MSFFIAWIALKQGNLPNSTLMSNRSTKLGYATMLQQSLLKRNCKPSNSSSGDQWSQPVQEHPSCKNGQLRWIRRRKVREKAWYLLSLSIWKCMNGQHRVEVITSKCRPWSPPIINESLFSSCFVPEEALPCHRPHTMCTRSKGHNAKDSIIIPHIEVLASDSVSEVTTILGGGPDVGREPPPEVLPISKGLHSKVMPPCLLAVHLKLSSVWHVVVNVHIGWAGKGHSRCRDQH